MRINLIKKPRLEDNIDKYINRFGQFVTNISNGILNKSKQVGKNIYNHRGIYAIGTGIVALGFCGYLALKDINKPYKVEGELKSIIKPQVEVLKQKDINAQKEKIAQKAEKLYQEHKVQEVKKEIKAKPQIEESKVVKKDIKQTVKYDPNSIVDTLKQKGMESDFECRTLLWNSLTRMEENYEGTASQNKILNYNLKNKTKAKINNIIKDYIDSTTPKEIISEKPAIKSEIMIKESKAIKSLEEKAKLIVKDVPKQEIKSLDVQDKGKISVVPKQRPNTLEQYVLEKDRHMKSDILLTKKFENWDFDPSKYRFFVDSQSKAIILKPINNDKLEFGKALSGESLYDEITAEKAAKLKDQILKDDMFNGTWSTLKILKNKQGEVAGYVFSPLAHITNERLDSKVRLHNPNFTDMFRVGHYF